MVPIGLELIVELVGCQKYVSLEEADPLDGKPLQDDADRYVQ
jgi:hypothetical protein